METLLKVTLLDNGDSLDIEHCSKTGVMLLHATFVG